MITGTLYAFLLNITRDIKSSGYPYVKDATWGGSSMQLWLENGDLVVLEAKLYPAKKKPE